MFDRFLTITSTLFFLFGFQAAFAQSLVEPNEFDPEATIAAYQDLIQRTDCTPICGNPTCCIAVSLRVTVFEADIPLDAANSITNGAVGSGELAAELMETGSTDWAVPLSQALDLDTALDLQSRFMALAEEALLETSCYSCCYACGQKVCCGMCWDF